MTRLAVAFDFIHGGGGTGTVRAMMGILGVGLPGSLIIERSGMMMGNICNPPEGPGSEDWNGKGYRSSTKASRPDLSSPLSFIINIHICYRRIYRHFRTKVFPESNRLGIHT